MVPICTTWTVMMNVPSRIAGKDLRPDSNASMKMKHSDPRYAVIKVEKKGWYKYNLDSFIVSMEVMTQLATARNLDPKSEPKVAWEKIYTDAKTLQTVNGDRFMVMQHEHVVQQTAYLVYDMFLDMKGRSLSQNFHSSQ